MKAWDFLILNLPSTTKLPSFCSYLQFLYRALYWEPTRQLVLAVHGATDQRLLSLAFPLSWRGALKSAA